MVQGVAGAIARIISRVKFDGRLEHSGDRSGVEVRRNQVKDYLHFVQDEFRRININ
jgi:hypothetical protein